MITAAAHAGRGALRIGTRGSALARAQTELVAAALADRDRATESIVITTAGDRRVPDTAWGEGAFVLAIETALLAGEIDLAVHSAKDVPTDEDPRLTVGAYLPRGEPRDALVAPAGAASSLDSLPSGARIGTDSPRRKGFILARRPDLVVEPLHGNVDTRLRRLDAGEADALVLAAAGLARLGRTERISELLDVEIMPPAPGQGAIAVQARSDDGAALDALRAIDHVPTRVAVEAERAFLNAMGGGCRAPVGALASIDPQAGTLSMIAGFAALDGRAAGLERVAGRLDDATALAQRLAERIIHLRARVPGAPRVLVTRPAAESRRLAARLSEFGVAALIAPAIEVELLDRSADLDAALANLADNDWVIVTSANGARALSNAARRLGVDLGAAGAVRWAAVGRASARELLQAGAPSPWLPRRADAAGLAAELPLESGQRALWLRGSLADSTLRGVLAERGAELSEVIVYRTAEAPASSRAALAEALEGGLDALVLASPSAVRGLLALAAADAGSSASARLRALPAVCVGPRTAAEARERGFSVVHESASTDSGSLAELAATLAFAGSA